MKKTLFTIGWLALTVAACAGSYLGMRDRTKVVELTIFKIISDPETGEVTDASPTVTIYQSVDSLAPSDVFGAPLPMIKMGDATGEYYRVESLSKPQFDSGVHTLHIVTSVEIDGKTYKDVDTVRVAERALIEWATGAINYKYELTSPPVGGIPIPDVSVWVTTDATGENVIHNTMTDQYGIADFWVDAGTMYFWRHKTGWNFENPDVKVITE